MDSGSSSSAKNGTNYDYDVENGGAGGGTGAVVDKGKRRAQPQPSSHSQDEDMDTEREQDKEPGEDTPLLSSLPTHARTQQSYSRLSRSQIQSYRRPGAPSTSTSALALPSPSSSTSPSHTRNTLYKTLFRVFLTTLSVTILLFILVLLLGWSYASRIEGIEPEQMVKEGVVVFRGPDRVEVVSVDAARRGVWVDVSGRIGVDAARAVGVERDGEDEDGVLRTIWKSLGRWGVRKVGSVGVSLDGVELWNVYGGNEDDGDGKGGSREEMLLMKVTIPALVVPLSADAPPRRTGGDLMADEDWLTPFSTRMFIQPAVDTKHLLKFVRQSWRTGYVRLKTRVKVAKVRLGGSGSGGLGGVHKEWSGNGSWLGKLLEKTMKDVKVGIRFRLPSMPGFPHPGHNLPFPSLSQFVTLTSFSARSDDVRGLVLDATATLPNPAPEDLQFTVPSMPFIISIPNVPSSPNVTLSTPTSYPLASVHTAPLTLSTHPNITLTITGTLLPLPPAVLPLLSAFISRYLSALPNPIIIAPAFMPPMLGDLQIPAEFPAPVKKPNVLRDVSIRDMRIRPGLSVGEWLASGVVVARVVLPPGVDVALEVGSVFPDVIIFDGEVPDEEVGRRVDGAGGAGAGSEDEETRRKSGLWGKRKGQHDNDDEDLPPPPPEIPLPDPLPDRAFAHLRPNGWVPAVSERERTDHDDDDGAGAGGGVKVKEVVYAVSAKVVDVPLEVLPGRQKEFRSFVSKVIFGSEGATAGLLGEAAVLVSVHGLPIVSRPSTSRSNRNNDADETNQPRAQTTTLTGKNQRKEAEVMLQGLPFRGSVRVGKKSMFGGTVGVGGADDRSKSDDKAKDWWDEVKDEMDRWGWW